MNAYSERLNERISNQQTPALVGLDPRLDLIPAEIRARASRKSGTDPLQVAAWAFEEFCIRIIDVVGGLVPAVKPQAAFFEELGPAGMQALQRVMQHARTAGLIVICDAKRGDIGSTALAYARGFLAGHDPASAPWAADALTVNAYLGIDTLDPFLEVAAERGAGIYILVRTSNPDAGSVQDHGGPSDRLYEHMAVMVEQLADRTIDSSGFGHVGAVVGATWPDELQHLRQVMPHVPLLVPGYGSQGAGAADVAGAFRADGLGALVNSSRGINFAWQREPYATKFGESNWEAAVEAATRDMIHDLATSTPAAALQQQ